MASEPPPTTKLVSEPYHEDVKLSKAYLVNGATSDITEDEAIRRRGRKFLWIGVGIFLALCLIGGGIGAGVAIANNKSKKSSDSSKAVAAPVVLAPAPVNATAEEFMFLPDPDSAEAAELRKSGSDEVKATYRLIDDARSITPEKIVQFLDHFDKVANLTGKGVDMEYYKDQAYKMMLWFRARGYQSVMDLLRSFAKGDNLNVAELAQAVEQLVTILQSKQDFTQFLKWPADKDDKLPQEALSSYAAANRRYEKLSSTNAAAGGTTNARTRNDPISNDRTNPVFQFQQANDPNGFINKRSVMCLPTFKPKSIGIVFHVLSYKDQRGYVQPYNVYAKKSSPAQYIIKKMNNAYKSACIQFYLKEYRFDPKRYKYLNLGSLRKWQNCASGAEECTCPLALKNNREPGRFLNIFIAGSTTLSYSDPNLALGYTTVIPNALDSCKDVMGWNVPSWKSSHMWLSWDEFDPDIANNMMSFDDGAMTVTHEAGHWLGLLHTHQGDCGNDDDITDTPANQDASVVAWYDKLAQLCAKNWGRSKKQMPQSVLNQFNSCRGDKYIDNVFNYMSYVPSSCYTLFTQGQVQRMQRVITHYYKNFATKKPAPKKKVPPKKPAPKKG